MYFVGIDISKYKHDCFITTETGTVITQNLSFQNNKDGFDKLLNLLKSLDNTQEIRKGIGTILCASIVAEFGDFNRFKSADACLAFAGLEPSTIQSGCSEYNGKMVKHGSSHLRAAIMNAADYVFMHEPIFTTYYYKKRNEGKAHRVALSHVAKKLVRVIYKIETSDIPFERSKLK